MSKGPSNTSKESILKNPVNPVCNRLFLLENLLVDASAIKHLPRLFWQWLDVNGRRHPTEFFGQFSFDLFGDGVRGDVVMLDFTLDVQMHLDEHLAAVSARADRKS